ncbi:MAG: hypothetical protein HY432_01935 [Candidatus Liptonbacteria bacterium]|nr:hypothetical protein [Candidatus Liptonbacteria bacterium]
MPNNISIDRMNGRVVVRVGAVEVTFGCHSGRLVFVGKTGSGCQAYLTDNEYQFAKNSAREAAEAAGLLPKKAA